MSGVGVLGLEAAPGTRQSGLLRIPGVEPAWEIPVVVVRGELPGPTFSLTAGMHAAEYVPMEAATRLAGSLDPKVMRGCVIAVLIVNTPGFYERSVYTNPRDGRNLNRAFPGNPQGPASERVASFLCSEVIAGSDAYLDAHCGDLIEALQPFVLWTRTGDRALDGRSEALARAFGLEYVMAIAPQSIVGTAMGAGASLGVPSISAEIGQQGICDDPSVERYLEGLRRILGHLGITDPAPRPLVEPTPLKEFAWNRAQATGTLHLLVRPGDRVSEGQLVATIRDWFGETLSEVRASATGIVTFSVTCLPIQEGDPVLGIGIL